MKLSLSEEFVLARLVDGDAPKLIADQRHVTRGAISQINRRIRTKMGAKTIYQAVAMYAVEQSKKGGG